MPRLHHARFKSRFILSCVLIAALLGALIFWKISADIRADRAAAFSQTQSFARAMAAHAATQVHVVDLSLRRAAESLGGLDPSALRDARKDREILRLSASVSDHGFWMHFLDVRGVGVASSNGLAVAGVSFADRRYFSVHRRHSEAGLFVGEPDVGRVSRRRVFFLSRGVFDARGDFVGVVVASVDAGAFAEVFANASLEPTLSIALMHADGRVVARAPLFESSFASNLRSSELYRHWKLARSGSYEGRSMVDGRMRVFSYQAVGDTPLAVVVGIAVEPWKRALSGDVAVALAALAIAALASWLSGRFALRSFERLAVADERQRRLNEELRLARDENARGEKMMRTIADSLPALVAYIDAQERYVFHNSQCRAVLGVDADRMAGRSIAEAMGDDAYLSVVDQVRSALDGKTVSFERDIKVGGEDRTFKFAYTPDIDQDGTVMGFCSMAIDITETKAAQERLHALARFDTLTGLANRAQLYDRLNTALARSRRGAPETACFYLDIDHFKAINDSLGHAGGDEALREFARRLQAAARKTDLVARMAGDEFVMVLEGLDQPGAAAVVANSVIEAMRTPFLIFGLEMSISTSVGVAVSNAQDQSADDLLRRADEALYSAKRAGRGMFKTSQRPAPRQGEA